MKNEDEKEYSIGICALFSAITAIVVLLVSVSIFVMLGINGGISKIIPAICSVLSARYVYRYLRNK